MVHLETVKAGAITGTNISQPSRSVRWAMLLNLLISPAITEKVQIQVQQNIIVLWYQIGHGQFGVKITPSNSRTFLC